jgi:HEAT repeat protein
MSQILAKLSGGDLRSEGRAAEVAGEITNHPQLLTDLTEGLLHTEKLIRARTCMTMEIISRDHPDLLAAVVPQLIELASTETVPQARWHLAETLGNVALSDEDAERIIPVLLGYLVDKSKIVKYCAVQTLGILARKSPLRGTVVNSISALRDESKSLAKAVTKALQNLGVE